MIPYYREQASYSALLWKESMIASARIGDYAVNECPRCRKTVRSRFELRTVRLARTRLVVPDLMVDVCCNCDHMISIAPEALAQLREAGVTK